MDRIFGYLVALVMALFCTGVILFVAHLVMSLFTGRFTKRGKIREEKEFKRQALLNPNFGAAEARLGRPIPKAVRHLYQNRDILFENEFYLISPVDDKATWLLACFLPATQSEMHNWPRIENAFFFAKTIEIASYFVLVGENPESPCPVFFFYAHTQEIERICDSLNDFLRWQKVEASVFIGEPFGPARPDIGVLNPRN